MNKIFQNILSHLPLFLLLMALSLNSCKNQGGKVTYDYLLKKETGDSSATNPKLEEDDKISESSGISSVTKVVKTAQSYLGTPYQYGGFSSKGLDCSGLTTLAYKSIRIGLPRSAKDQSEFGKNIPRDQIKLGDILCFSAYENGKIDHVGLVTSIIGEEVTFIHATVHGGVRYDRLDIGYWSKRYMKSRRVY